MKKNYFMKNNAPIVGVDTFETQPQNYCKVGFGEAISDRQFRNTVILRKNNMGYGDAQLNVVCEGSNSKSYHLDIEDACLDVQAPYRVRPSNLGGGNTREFAKDVPLWTQILTHCIIAHGTFNEIDNVDDFKRFEPTMKGMNTALKDIKAFDDAVVNQGYNRMIYGWQDRSLNEWNDGPWEGTRKENNSEAAHTFVRKFDSKDPFSFSFLKLKSQKVFASAAVAAY
jgi:hypothetical protein